MQAWRQMMTCTGLLAETVAFLQAILPYAFEKAQQVQIALAVTPNSAVADCVALRALQGRYGKKT